MSKSTKSAGMTAMAHARAWVAERHPGSLVLEAGARLSRFPDKNRTGEWITHTVREDLFGVFDLAVFPTHVGHLALELIQATTIARDLSAVRVRQAKVGNWIHHALQDRRPRWLDRVFVVGWVSRKHLRIWEWSWEARDAHTPGGWIEQATAPAKLPKRDASGGASKDPASTDPMMPF